MKVKISALVGKAQTYAQQLIRDTPKQRYISGAHRTCRPFEEYNLDQTAADARDGQNFYSNRGSKASHD